MAVLALCLHLSTPALADGAEERAEPLDELRRLVAAQADTIARLERQVQSLDAQVRALTSSEDRHEPESPPRDRPRPSRQAMPPSPPSLDPDPLTLSGDARIRYEANTGKGEGADRHRGVARLRLGARYRFSERWSVGARLVTGDADDPNSSDVTLSNFNGDLEIGLDQLFARYRAGRGSIYAGKFPQVFSRTDLVWDGDVMPQGLAGDFDLPFAGGNIAARALAFLIDEQTIGDDSTMLRAQVEWESRSNEPWSGRAAVGYYDYEIGSLAAADAGDIRSNRVGADGMYRSDFDLLDTIVGMSYSGLDPRWPVTLRGNYVVNTGAIDERDSGWAADLFVGRAREGHWRFRYGYARAQTDAVLAAFSQNNIRIPTNYRLHTATVDYRLDASRAMNLTFFRYRPLEEQAEAAITGWQNRFRLNLLFSF
jgi:uncharacterized coiled-coil protein SlyX